MMTLITELGTFHIIGLLKSHLTPKFSSWLFPLHKSFPNDQLTWNSQSNLIFLTFQKLWILIYRQIPIIIINDNTEATDNSDDEMEDYYENHKEWPSASTNAAGWVRGDKEQQFIMQNTPAVRISNVMHSISHDFLLQCNSWIHWILPIKIFLYRFYKIHSNIK